MTRTPETDIAASAIRYLRDLGWDIYQEVSTGCGEPRCDIVARLGQLLWAVECKARLGFDVIQQAARWVGHAHRVSVCVGRLPPGAYHDATSPIRKYLDWLGVGVLVARARDEAAARHNLIARAESGVIDGVVVRRDGKRILFDVAESRR